LNEPSNSAIHGVDSDCLDTSLVTWTNPDLLFPSLQSGSTVWQYVGVTCFCVPNFPGAVCHPVTRWQRISTFDSCKWLIKFSYITIPSMKARHTTNVSCWSYCRSYF